MHKYEKFNIANRASSCLLLQIYNHIIIYQSRSIGNSDAQKDEPKRDRMDNLGAGK